MDEQLVRINKEFVKPPADFVVEGRRLIREGSVDRQDSHGRMQSRYVFLFNDMFVVAKEKKRSRYVVKQVKPFSDVQLVSDGADKTEFNGPFCFRVVTSEREFIFSLPDDVLQRAWLDAFSEQFRAQQQQKEGEDSEVKQDTETVAAAAAKSGTENVIDVDEKEDDDDDDSEKEEAVEQQDKAKQDGATEDSSKTVEEDEKEVKVVADVQGEDDRESEDESVDEAASKQHENESDAESDHEDAAVHEASGGEAEQTEDRKHSDDTDEQDHVTGTADTTGRAITTAASDVKVPELSTALQAHVSEALLKNVDGEMIAFYRVVTESPERRSRDVRFSQMYQFHKEVKSAASASHVTLPAFPRRTLFRNNSDAFLEKRRAALDELIRAVCDSQELASLDMVHEFLGVSTTASHSDDGGLESSFYEEHNSSDKTTAATAHPDTVQEESGEGGAIEVVA